MKNAAPTQLPLLLPRWGCAVLPVQHGAGGDGELWEAQGQWPSPCPQAQPRGWGARLRWPPRDAPSLCTPEPAGTAASPSKPTLAMRHLGRYRPSHEGAPEMSPLTAHPSLVQSWGHCRAHGHQVRP